MRRIRRSRSGTSPGLKPNQSLASSLTYSTRPPAWMSRIASVPIFVESGGITKDRFGERTKHFSKRAGTRQLPAPALTTPAPAILEEDQLPARQTSSLSACFASRRTSCRRASAASSVISRISAKDCSTGETTPRDMVMNGTLMVVPSAAGACTKPCWRSMKL
ncbi:MAG: hypothetical protein MZV64_19625 [Ignavibacteriales bacterium]|nr:hypothetical protein [Ignavibacteriales bacterium]